MCLFLLYKEVRVFKYRIQVKTQMKNKLKYWNRMNLLWTLSNKWTAHRFFYLYQCFTLCMRWRKRITGDWIADVFFIERMNGKGISEMKGISPVAGVSNRPFSATHKAEITSIAFGAQKGHALKNRFVRRLKNTADKLLVGVLSINHQCWCVGRFFWKRAAIADRRVWFRASFWPLWGRCHLSLNQIRYRPLLRLRLLLHLLHRDRCL